MNSSEQPSSCVGRSCIISIQDKLFEATVVDFYPDKPSRPKRVRVQSKGAEQGEVKGPTEYILKAWC